MTSFDPAPKVLHDLLNAAWRHNDGFLGSGFNLYKSINIDGDKWCIRVGGDASGFTIGTPRSESDPDYGTYTILKWDGKFNKQSGFLLGEKS